MNSYRLNSLAVKPDNDFIKLELSLAYLKDQINLLTLLNTAAIL